jgi:hypothetical protein
MLTLGRPSNRPNHTLVPEGMFLHAQNRSQAVNRATPHTEHVGWKSADHCQRPLR